MPDFIGEHKGRWRRDTGLFGYRHLQSFAVELGCSVLENTCFGDTILQYFDVELCLGDWGMWSVLARAVSWRLRHLKCFGYRWVLEIEACEVFWLELCVGDWGIWSVLARAVSWRLGHFKCFGYTCVLEIEACEVFWLELCLGNWVIWRGLATGVSWRLRLVKCFGYRCVLEIEAYEGVWFIALFRRLEFLHCFSQSYVL
jgi:hypothetical protein